MKTLLLTTVLSTLLSNGTHTTPLVMPERLPEKCPSVASMLSQGLDHVSPFMLPGNNAWVGIKENSHYDTNDNWTLFTAGEGDKNGRVAIQQLSKNIGSMQFEGGPELDKETGLVICAYKNDSAEPLNFAFAITPSIYS
jgi:hypothetical protein